jgi:transglutaminase-like putative cysteine protease
MPENTPQNGNRLAGYLKPGRFIDSDDKAVITRARAHVGSGGTDRELAVRLYYDIRDNITYSPYRDFADPATYTASACLAAGQGFCVAKAALLSAMARAVGIPARVGFADVRNHLTSKRLYELMGTDVFLWHGYSDLYLDGRWVKATPAFDLGLCQKFGVKPLEFDGTEDSLLHEFDQTNRRHMEYVRDRGQFDDVPFEQMRKDFREHYPGLFAERAATGRLHDEA